CVRMHDFIVPDAEERASRGTPTFDSNGHSAGGSSRMPPSPEKRRPNVTLWNAALTSLRLSCPLTERGTATRMNAKLRRALKLAVDARRRELIQVGRCPAGFANETGYAQGCRCPSCTAAGSRARA